MGVENYITFVVATLLFVVTPGMDTIFVLNKSIGKGKKSGMYATFGVNSGILMHTLFAALGLSVLIAKSEFVFAFIKYAGALYIMYLGLVSLKKRKEFSTETTQDIKGGRSESDFWSGFLNNVLNPKVALFFLAFFPRFIAPDQMENPVPFMLLGLTYAVMGMSWLLILTVCAGTFSRKFIANPRARIALHTGSGLVFILMGITIGCT